MGIPHGFEVGAKKPTHYLPSPPSLHTPDEVGLTRFRVVETYVQCSSSPRTRGSVLTSVELAELAPAWVECDLLVTQ